MPLPDIQKGGFEPGSPMFGVDGDHSLAQNVGKPRISWPFEGDSIVPPNGYALWIDPGTSPTFAGDQDPKPNAKDAQGNPTTGAYISIPGKFGLPVVINKNSDNFILEQDFEMAADYWMPLPLNTPYDRAQYAPNYAGDLDIENAILIAEGPVDDAGSGQVKWTRYYAKVPNQRQGYEDFPYNYIGLSPTYEPGFGPYDAEQHILTTGRNRFTKKVKSHLVYDYILIGDGTNGTTKIEDVELFQEQRYFYATLYDFVDFIFNKDQVPPGFYSDLGLTPDDTGGFPGAPTPNESTPNVEVYLNSWVANGYELVAETSVLKQWRGNIYERVTRYVPVL